MNPNRHPLWTPTLLLFRLYACVFAAMITSNRANAFVEMVRFGYNNCTTCHVSPNGGGILTDYGRGLSLEALSRWGTEKETGPLHGFVHNISNEEMDRWLGYGGDLRAVQFKHENELARRERFVWMQGQFELAGRIKKWTVDFAVGKFGRNSTWSADAPRFFVVYQVNDYHLLRVGRFLPTFGLNIPEHISPTRGSLGLGFYSERDGAEWHFLSERWNAALGYANNPQMNSFNGENSIFGQLQYTFFEKYKVGASGWAGWQPDTHREIFGIHGVLGFTKQTYLLGELDCQLVHPDNAETRVGYYGYYRLGYEITKGVHLLGLFDHLQSDKDQSTTLVRHWGPGVAFYPRPHFELTAAWTRELNKAISNQEGDYAWLQLHYYL